ncbi:MAG: PAS domain S-box protein, partial [bacterium]
MGGRKKQGQGDRAAGAEGVEHFRSLLQHHPLPAFVIETGAADPLAYRFLAVNRAAELLYGYTEAEFLEMTLADLRPPEETTISTQQVADLTREGRAAFRTTRAHRHRKKDGSIIHVEVSSQSIPWKELQALLAVVQDVTARVKAEQSLMESEEKYRTLLDSSLTGVFLTQEGVFIYVNDKLAEISGMTREELIGTDAMATVHPDDRPGQRRLMEDLLGGRKSSIRQSFRVLHRSGEARQVEIMASVVWVSGQRAVLGTAIDITERQRAEESLKLFSAAVGEARDGMQLVDLDGRVVYSNKAVERIYGYTHEELRGLDVGKMNADPRFARRHILPALRRDGHWSGQLTVLHKDGHPFPVELSTSMVFGQDGQPVAMVGIIRDITARRAAEQKLEQSEELFRTIFRTSPDAIAINRMRDGVYVRINDGFTAVTGYRVRDVLGKSTSQIGIWSHPEELARLAEKLRKEGKVSGFEATFRLKDGRERTGLLSAHVVSIDGEPHAVSVTRDIEDIKQVEVNLKKALAALEEKNRELEAFVYTAAHDLRTPLISVLGFIELLKRELTGRLEK